MVEAGSDISTEFHILRWPEITKAMFLYTGEIEDLEIDTLMVLFVENRPATSVDANVEGDLLIRYDPETGEVVGVEIEGFERSFIGKHHPELADSWGAPQARGRRRLPQQPVADRRRSPRLRSPPQGHGLPGDACPRLAFRGYGVKRHQRQEQAFTLTTLEEGTLQLLSYTPICAARSRKSVATMSKDGSGVGSGWRSGPNSMGLGTKAVFRPCAPAASRSLWWAATIITSSG